MPHTASLDILSSIEARQDELLRQLDELNDRIERTLARFGGPCPNAAADTTCPRPPWIEGGGLEAKWLPTRD